MPPPHQLPVIRPQHTAKHSFGVTIVNLPEGIGVLPYRLPGSPTMTKANLAGLRDYRIVVWSKHGVMARSD